MAQARNTSISIAQGIAIILMVAGHAECPGTLMSLIYIFHMPLFFITAGYFFTRRNVEQPWDFCCKRFKGLYVPFVKWSLFFLLIHNVMFQVGILNEAFGNWEGGVTHPYSLRQALQRAVHIFTAMAGYDEFLAGAFWFFRALLISSILFLVIFRLIDGRSQRLKGWHIAAIIAVAAIGFAALRISFGLKVVNVVQGGIRETWGILFFAIGVIYRHFEASRGFSPRHWGYWAAMAAAVAVLVAGTMNHWAGMNLAPKIRDVATLPLTGIAGFFVTHQLSRLIDGREWWLKRLLVLCGERSLYVYVFHIISFKVVSLVKIAYYGLDPRQIGCHMVIHDHHDDAFWLLYTLVGVALPLLWLWGYRHLKAKVQALSA